MSKLSGLLMLSLFAAGCGAAFHHGPLGLAPKDAPVTAIAEAFRDQMTRWSSSTRYQPCWIVFVAADGLTEVRCPYPFVPEGVEIFRKCLDPQWPHGMMLPEGLIVACGRKGEVSR